MRILRFIVDGQVIKSDPTCDFSGLFLRKKSNVKCLCRIRLLLRMEWSDESRCILVNAK